MLRSLIASLSFISSMCWLLPMNESRSEDPEPWNSIFVTLLGFRFFVILYTIRWKSRYSGMFTIFSEASSIRAEHLGTILSSRTLTSTMCLNHDISGDLLSL